MSPSYLLYPWRIFIKFWSNVQLSETYLQIPLLSMLAQSQSQLKVMSLNLRFPVCSISPLPVEGFSLNFSHMFTSVRLLKNSTSSGIQTLELVIQSRECYRLAKWSLLQPKVPVFCNGNIAVFQTAILLTQ